MQGQLTKEFGFDSGMQQGNALLATLFILVLEATIKKLDQGLITTKSVLVCGYAHDIRIVNKGKKSVRTYTDYV